MTNWISNEQDRNSIIRRGETGFTTVQLNSRGQKYVTFSYYSNSTQVDYRGVAADAPRLKIHFKFQLAVCRKYSILFMIVSGSPGRVK